MNDVAITDALKEVWIPNVLPFLLGSLIAFIGIASMVIWIIRIRTREIYFLYMGVFILLFGLRSLAGNDLIRITGIVPTTALLWAESLISYFLAVFSILFVTRFIGWGWKRSLYWFLLLQIGYAVTATIADAVLGVPYKAGIPWNNIFAITGTLLVLANLFQSPFRMDHEIKMLGFGFGIFALSILFANLAEIRLLPGIFSQEQPALFLCLCIMIYVAIHRNTAAENKLLMVKRDLDTAHEIQAGIIPRHIPSPEGFRISARYVPMAQVGGDFYDFHRIDEYRFGILVADVSGHGIPAALIASMVKIAFLSQLPNAARPETLLYGMNNTLTGQLDNEFITVIYLVIDLESRQITYATAGHPAPILLGRGQNTERPLRSGGIPLGIRQDMIFPCWNINLAAGDRVIIYTDGLTESASHRGEMFGTGRLFHLMEESLELHVDQAAERILSSVIKWTGKKKSESLDDDLTFILFDAGGTTC